jgi:hypothetical protein
MDETTTHKTEIVQDNPGRYKTLKNGAIMDIQTGKFAPGGNVTTAIADTSQARAMVARKMELKRAAMIEAANRVAAEGGSWDGTGYDYAAAIAEAAMQTALNVDSTRQIAAAEMLLRETGVAERLQPADAPAGASISIQLDADAVVRIAQLLQHVTDRQTDST